MPQIKSKRQASLSSRVNDIMIQVLSNVLESESTLEMAELDSEIIPHIRLEKSLEEIVAEQQQLHTDLKKLKAFCENIRKENQEDSFHPAIKNEDLNSLKELILSRKKTLHSESSEKEDLETFQKEIQELEKWTNATFKHLKTKIES